MAENDAERTEAATPRRVQEAREQGQIARSQDLTAAVILLAGMLALNHFGPGTFMLMRQSMELMLSPAVTTNPTRLEDLQTWLVLGGQALVLCAAPVALAVMVAALIISFFQVGFLLTTHPLQPNLNKLNPLKGVKNLFDTRAWVRLAMSIVKLVIIAAITAWFISRDIPRILHLCKLELMPMISAASQMVYDLALKLTILLILIAVIDYAFQRWQHSRDLRMSKEEVKEEMKRMEGDPLLKQRRARVARQLALQRLGQDVPRADVVVTNPTHFAVALRYDETMRAPKVIAKGADFLALRIRQIAMGSGVPLVERKELARALYRNVEVGQEVPPEYYSAIAEILAYVYRMNGKMSA